ncbi:MAG: DUF362 domain-containing protein [Chloroflexi bacterium]|nr:DUF362 domain-containing protein [Chloroflexota bacterium]
MSRVTVLKTSPASIIRDYGKLMRLAEYNKFLPQKNQTILKLNLSWTQFYPSCSTPPWQLEGVIKTMREDGYRDIIAVENQTVVTHPWKGAYYNKWLPILEKYSVKFQPLTDVEWIPYAPKNKMLAMNNLFNEILIPKMFLGANIIHLPTMKTHGHTTTTGAMKNAFGGLIPKYRHHAHKKIHEVLVDLLTIQKEILAGLFAVTDGCVCGNGAGPRTMKPFAGNVILASNDQVALDAVAAKIMGFNPYDIDYIKLADEQGLGSGNISMIDIIGPDIEDINNLNFGFKVKKSPVIKYDQLLRKKTQNINWLHTFLFHSPVFKSFIFASEFYHDRLWYPFIGKDRIRQFNKTEWGLLFGTYQRGKLPEFKKIKDWDPY